MFCAWCGLRGYGRLAGGTCAVFIHDELAPYVQHDMRWVRCGRTAHTRVVKAPLRAATPLGGWADFKWKESLEALLLDWKCHTVLL